MGFNGVGRFTIEPGEKLPLNGWVFGNGEDHGAQYFSANPTFSTAGFMLVMSEQNKTRLPGGGVAYGFTVENTDNTPPVVGTFPIFFDVQGGGFIRGFNGVGRFTIEPGEKLPLNGWVFGNGEDQGAQYFSANPISPIGSMLVMSEQNKTRSPNGAVFYGFTVENKDTKNSVSFDVQGGGFNGGFNGVGRYTVGPGDKIFLNGWAFRNGEDHGAQYFSANPTSSAGSMLIMSDQSKARELNGGINNSGAVSYGFSVENTDTVFPVFFDVQGGGFI